MNLQIRTKRPVKGGGNTEEIERVLVESAGDNSDAEEAFLKFQAENVYNRMKSEGLLPTGTEGEG